MIDKQIKRKGKKKWRESLATQAASEGLLGKLMRSLWLYRTFIPSPIVSLIEV